MPVRGIRCCVSSVRGPFFAGLSKNGPFVRPAAGYSIRTVGLNEAKVRQPVRKREALKTGQGVALARE